MQTSFPVGVGLRRGRPEDSCERWEIDDYRSVAALVGGKRDHWHNSDLGCLTRAQERFGVVDAPGHLRGAADSERRISAGVDGMRIECRQPTRDVPNFLFI